MIPAAPRPRRTALLVIGVVCLVLTPIAYVGFMLTRPLATRGDVESTLAAYVNHDPVLASGVCGEAVRGLRWPTPKLEELRYGEWPWPKVSIESWRPLVPRSGTATAQVSGVGFDDREKVITGMHAGRVRFSYHCAWEDNGRSNNFRCSIETPELIR